MYINNLRAPGVSNSENCFQVPGSLKRISLNVTPLAFTCVLYVSFSITKELIKFDYL